MRKVIQAFCLFLCTALVSVQTTQAASLSAANIFKTIGGNTTVDRGGAIHSQTRSIYSLGGGMTTFEGKRVSLLAADPPSFSAGCNGISWHFGGFAFISLDEIRQLVEAVAQASLGIAVDLAMQTLCPQCYAVMSKLRDMSNLMRNAAADACTIATNFGNILAKEYGLSTSTDRAKKCSTGQAEDGKTSSFLDSWAGSACRLLDDAEKKLKTEGQGVMDFLKFGNTTGKTPPKDAIDASGNVTYKALSALGYQDGVIKDMMLSVLGMSVIHPVPGYDCREAFKDLYATAETNKDTAGLEAGDAAVMNAILANPSKDKVTPTTTGSEVTVNDAKTKTGTPQTGGTNSGMTLCHAPPLLTGMKDVGRTLLCGNSPEKEGAFFAGKFGLAMDTLRNSSLGSMCLVKMNATMADPWVYKCRGDATGECREPQMVHMSTMVDANPVNGYTGIAWMVGDALYSGVLAVRANEALPDNTKAILNGSGWPLYRLLNMAAVYPALAGELVNAYSSAIAAQYAMDSLDKVARIGAQPGISMKSINGLRAQDITAVREHIMELIRQGNSTKTEVLSRLAEKSQLVDVVMRVNKTLQAEVIGQGLGGNTNLAVSIKRQLEKKTKP